MDSCTFASQSISTAVSTMRRNDKSDFSEPQGDSSLRSERDSVSLTISRGGHGNDKGGWGMGDETGRGGYVCD